LPLERLEDRHMLATITVTSLADNTAVDGQVTLREAIHAAELDTSIDGSAAGNGADIIEFAANLAGNLPLSILGDALAGPSALLLSTNVTIRGNPAGITLTRDAAAPDMRLFRVSASGNLTLESLNLTGGVARGADGAAPGENAGNGDGGAVLNQGTLTIIACALYNNLAAGGNATGGGLRGAGRGGALYNDAATLAIRNSTFSANSAVAGTGAGAPSASLGGTIYGLNGTITIHNSTITLGSALSASGAFIFGDNGTATVGIFSSIIGQAQNPSAFDLNITYDTNGTVVVSGANNLIRRQNDFHSITVSADDPLLGPLQNNGGPTLTHLLAGDSPALNQGTNLLNLSTDQRGPSFARVIGDISDIGAVELQTVPPPPLLGDYNGNEVVDAADYVAWRNSLNTAVPQYTGADGSGNSTIDAADYTVWRQNFGNVLPIGAAAGSEVQPAAAVASPSETPAARLLAASSAGTDFIPWSGQQIKPQERPDRTHRIAVVTTANHDLALLTLLAESDLGDDPIAVIAEASFAKIDAVNERGCADTAETEALWTAWPFEEWPAL
jgi:hypothetical protein